MIEGGASAPAPLLISPAPTRLAVVLKLSSTEKKREDVGHHSLMLLLYRMDV